MKPIILILGVIACLIQIQGLTDDKFKRALQGLRILEDEDHEPRGYVRVTDCTKLGEACRGWVNCCGTTQCYWEDGYNALEDGKCVKCVSAGKKCQRDSQCCGAPDALQCDKGNMLWLDGRCQKYRSTGRCYRNGQCVKDCVKKWYKINGECS